MSDQWMADHSAAVRAFETGAVWAASDAELMRHLRAVTTGGIGNQAIHPAEINRGTAILAILAERRLQEERRRNDLLAEANRSLVRRNNAIALSSLMVAVASLVVTLLTK